MPALVSGWMALPLLLSLVAVRGSATLKLQGNDKGQIQFEPTGAAKLMGDERSINTTVDFVVGGDLIVGDQAASAVNCSLSSEAGSNVLNSSCAIEGPIPSWGLALMARIDHLEADTARPIRPEAHRGTR